MNATKRRTIEPVDGWGPTAFEVTLTQKWKVSMFLGQGWLLEDDHVTPTFSQHELDLFLELQRESRIPDSLL